MGWTTGGVMRAGEVRAWRAGSNGRGGTLLIGTMSLGLLSLATQALAERRLEGAEPPAAIVPIQLAEPMRGRWKFADSGLAPADVQLELKLGPRGIPRSRFVGSTMLKAERDSTWIEFNQSKADQVLKLRVDCQADPELEVSVTPFLQVNATSQPTKYSSTFEQRVEQYAEFVARRSEWQLQMLGGGSSKGKPSKAPASVQRARMVLEYQLKGAEEARERLARLSELRDKLEGTAGLEIRATRVADLTPVRLEAVAWPQGKPSRSAGRGSSTARLATAARSASARPSKATGLGSPSTSSPSATSPRGKSSSNSGQAEPARSGESRLTFGVDPR